MQLLKNKDARRMIENAIAEDEQSDKEKMRGLVGKRFVSFYVLFWNSPSNSGSTLIAVNKFTCEEIVDILYSSEE